MDTFFMLQLIPWSLSHIHWPSAKAQTTKYCIKLLHGVHNGFFVNLMICINVAKNTISLLHQLESISPRCSFWYPSLNHPNTFHQKVLRLPPHSHHSCHLYPLIHCRYHYIPQFYYQHQGINSFKTYALVITCLISLSFHMQYPIKF